MIMEGFLQWSKCSEGVTGYHGHTKSYPRIITNYTGQKKLNSIFIFPIDYIQKTLNLSYRNFLLGLNFQTVFCKTIKNTSSSYALTGN